METNLKKTKDTSLLSLEKKLQNGSTEDIIINKFRLKPEMKVKEIIKEKETFQGMKYFLENFKKSTEEIVSNPEKAEIESKNANQNGKYIKMNLALGVLDLKPKQNDDNQDLIYNTIVDRNKSIENQSNNTNNFANHPLLDNKADEEILKFLMKNSKPRRRRIHKIKYNK